MRLFPRGLTHWLLPALALALLLATARVCLACDTPVFRYALERWEPDAFPLIVFHQGTLGLEQEKLLGQLEAAGLGKGLTNLRVQRENVDELSETASSIWAGQSSAATLPWAVLVFPGGPNKGLVAWAGALTAENVAAIIDSPLRQEMVRKLTAGDGLVWVQVVSGDAAKDQQADQDLRQSLDKVTQMTQPAAPAAGAAAEGAPTVIGPDGAMPGEPSAEAAAPVLLKHSILTLSRQDPAEKVLLAMLLRSEPDLETSDQAMVFPVFGRGRALYVLAGRGINQSNVLAACSFLSGSCSCEIKEQNPGCDLLLTANWTAGLTTTVVDAQLTSIAGLADVAGQLADSDDARDTGAAGGVGQAASASAAEPLAAASLATNPVAPAPIAAATRSPLAVNLLLAAGALLLVVVLASVALKAKLSRAANGSTGS